MFLNVRRVIFAKRERITRYKLIKSGKNWVRTSVSRLGLFRVMRGGVDEKIMVQYDASSRQMPADLVKGMVVLGALAGQQQLLTQYLLRKMEWIRLLGLKSAHRLVEAGQDSFVLGTTSITDSVSASQSISESVSFSESASDSLSLSQSVSLSESHVVSNSAESVHQNLLVALSRRMMLFM